MAAATAIGLCIAVAFGPGTALADDAAGSERSAPGETEVTVIQPEPENRVEEIEVNTAPNEKGSTGRGSTGAAAESLPKTGDGTSRAAVALAGAATTALLGCWAIANGRRERDEE